jgi:SAM-dependent methyltransferase
MKPLYLAPPVRSLLGTCLRPGGKTLTDRIIRLTGVDRESVVLDAGCGQGASIHYLREAAVDTIIGLDLEPELLHLARRDGLPVAGADLAFLPLPDDCLDMVLCECVWNLTDRLKTLAEFARTLQPDGLLALTDIYARRNRPPEQDINWPVSCCFSQATDLVTVERLVAAAGFTIVVLEDHSRLLTRTAAEFVFAHGSLHGFWQAVIGNPELATVACNAAATIRPGLFLLIARKNIP